MTERDRGEDRDLSNSMETCEKEKPLVKDLNEHIVCPLCRGYLIDATTLTECLHSFCRGCIVRRLSSGARLCPVCNVSASPPLLPDPRLQRLVYLVVPGLFRSELERRRHFRLVNPQCPPLPSPFGALELTLDDFVSLSLRELTDTKNEETQGEKSVPLGIEKKDNEESTVREPTTRYLKCPAAVTVRHLVRLLTLKRGWEETNSGVNMANRIEMTCEDYNGDPRGRRKPDVLKMSWTLLDLACIFGWKKEAPLKLFYRIVPRKEESASTSKSSPCKKDNNKDGPTIENIQRPPTPPPSPKPVQDNDAESRRTFGSRTEAPRTLETTKEQAKETKSKKPRCEVTPVMRAPDPVGISSVTIQQSNHATESSRTKELARLEHRKRRKRRNKRVIAEITTTPREDLLKLKVRLTPCPPRITSSSSNGQAKEKLLQMRAVRREKLKACALNQKRSVNLPREEDNINKECPVESEETIEDIIDCIPDEVVRVAQNINVPAQDDNSSHDKKDNEKSSKVSIQQKEETQVAETLSKSPIENTVTTVERPKKDEEILRRLGLVAINEANESLRDKAKQRGQNYNEKPNDLDREKLEKQLRESKANRVRSLLAEKQMRDALKGIMSKTKEEGGSSTSSMQHGIGPCPKKKGPPPLAPLRVVKPSSGFAVTSTMVESNNPKPQQTSLTMGSFLRKSKDMEQRRGQDSNLRTLSDVAVSRLSSCISEKNSIESHLLGSTGIPASKVALRIPQPHHRISSGYGMKNKPNLGVRHIPNPQAVVASQYRNQRAVYFNNLSQHPP
ncbi:polycomb group protein Psc-like isoform X5 [Vespa velutina]|uniref:polycomb group protein Psc-like isoform X5 n=1 Tax=Vespa velutina TaxID=202808 RepID=UPI001FB45005|nr:polycomb group protein Psc-like isoform X5 [Vespa velutina]